MCESNKIKFITRKSSHGGTIVESYAPSLTEGKTWHIYTAKGSRGVIRCTATEGVQKTSSGFDSFSYDLFGANKKELGELKAMGTVKNLETIHVQGLQKFYDEMEKEKIKKEPVIENSSYHSAKEPDNYYAGVNACISDADMGL